MYPGNSLVRDPRRFHGSAVTCFEIDVEDALLLTRIGLHVCVAIFVDFTLAAEWGIWNSSIAAGTVCSVVSSSVTIDWSSGCELMFVSYQESNLDPEA
jgi:hypothetical protein